jgi:hypothetical protein
MEAILEMIVEGLGEISEMPAMMYRVRILVFAGELLASDAVKLLDELLGVCLC